MSRSVWLYVSVPNECVKVFASYDMAREWLRHYDRHGIAVEYPLEEEETAAIAPRRTDVRILLDAFLDARAILGDYLEPNMPRSAGMAVERLLNALMKEDVLAAISRIEGRQRFGLVEAG
jgi:hypothetical protein